MCVLVSEWVCGLLDLSCGVCIGFVVYVCASLYLYFCLYLCVCVYVCV